MEKSIAEMQREVDLYISQFKEGYFSPLAMLARMSEEVGELAREVNHEFGEKPKRLLKQTIPLSWSLGTFCLSRFVLPTRSGLTWRRHTTKSCINLIHAMQIGGLQNTD